LNNVELRLKYAGSPNLMQGWKPPVLAAIIVPKIITIYGKLVPQKIVNQEDTYIWRAFLPEAQVLGLETARGSLNDLANNIAIILSDLHALSCVREFRTCSLMI